MTIVVCVIKATHFTMVNIEHVMVGDEEALKAEICALLDTINLGTLRRIRATIEKRRCRQSRTSTCKPGSVPPVDWKPKHQRMTKKALQLIQEGAGVSIAPFAVGPEGWTRKLFAASIAERLVHDGESNTPLNDRRSEMAKSSITVASLTARIVAAANVLKTANPGRFNGARLAMQNSRQDAGWSKATTRGSGVVMNDDGVDLFAVAAEQVGMWLV